MAPFITRVALKHYRSIGSCDVRLGALTFLVGANGSGKSNFVDALRLVTDSLRSSLDHALRERGGIQEVRRRSSGHPTHTTVRVDFELEGGDIGHFAFELGARRPHGFVVKREECRVGQHQYRVREGAVIHAPATVAPPASDDRLYLVNAAGLPSFRRVFDALASMGFYNLNPDAMRALQAPDTGEVLKRDGSNLASVFRRLDVDVRRRVEEYLERVVPGIEGVEPSRVQHMESLVFRQRVEGAREPWRFPALAMSDGTLRALGVLAAVFQSTGSRPVPFVGIEEPEVALHPAAAGLLRDCLREASARTQVLVTSHSPDLLDDASIQDDELQVVTMDAGATQIGPVDDAVRSALKSRLYTAGELLRIQQLVPDLTAARRASAAQLELFEVEVS